MTRPLPDEPAEVIGIVAAVLGVEPEAVARVSSFAGNRLFRVSHSTKPRASFFKFGSMADVAREHLARRLAAEAGVPVPGFRQVRRCAR